MPTFAIPELNWLILLIDYSIKIVAIGVVPENRRPSSSTAWLLVILLLPVVGLPLYFLLGSAKITGRRNRIQALANQELTRRLRHLPDLPPGVREEGHRELNVATRLGRRLTAIPALTGSNAGLYEDYYASIGAMIAAIDAAERYVHVEMYIFALDEVTEPLVNALHRAQLRGVAVKVLFDHVGTWKYPGYRLLKKRLKAAGIAYYLMLPANLFRFRWRRLDLRNHRKILVVDGERAFMGSQNMIEPEYQSRTHHLMGRQWVDVMVEVTGPVVTALDAVFAIDWLSEADVLPMSGPTPKDMRVDEGDERVNIFQVLPSGPGFDTAPNLRVFNDLIYSARHRLRIVSPYFVPDESILMAITTAAYSGVEVELYVNEKADQFMVGHAQQSYYFALLEAGVRIYRYPSPKVLHSKFFVVDDAVAVMGSSNMDMRSFGLNYEVSMVVTGGNLIADLSELADHYRAASTVLTQEQWNNRPWKQRYLDNVFRLTSALQ